MISKSGRASGHRNLLSLVGHITAVAAISFFQNCSRNEFSAFSAGAPVSYVQTTVQPNSPGLPNIATNDTHPAPADSGGGGGGGTGAGGYDGIIKYVSHGTCGADPYAIVSKINLKKDRSAATMTARGCPLVSVNQNLNAADIQFIGLSSFTYQGLTYTEDTSAPLLSETVAIEVLLNVQMQASSSLNAFFNIILTAPKEEISSTGVANAGRINCEIAKLSGNNGTVIEVESFSLDFDALQMSDYSGFGTLTSLYGFAYVGPIPLVGVGASISKSFLLTFNSGNYGQLGFVFNGEVYSSIGNGPVLLTNSSPPPYRSNVSPPADGQTGGDY